MDKEKFLLCVLVIGTIITACSLTVNVIKNSNDVGISSSHDTSVSADSTNVNLKIK